MLPRPWGFPDAWVSFATRRKGWAYTQDQLPTTHPIVADIPDLEAAKLNFDGITYAKGASVLKQLVGFVGEEAFFRGAQRYFARHAFGNTTLPDLLTALEEASGRDLAAWSAAWLQTTGVAELSAERTSDGLELAVSTVRPDRVTVGLYGDAGGRLVRRGEIATDVVAPRTPLEGARHDDVVLVVPNDDDRTYAKVRLDAASTAAVARGLSTIDDALARAVIWAALWNATRDGILPARRYIDIVARHAPEETDAALLTDATVRAAFTVGHFAADDDRAPLAAQWLDTAWNALSHATPGSDAQLIWARTVGTAASVCGDRAADLRQCCPEPSRRRRVCRWTPSSAGRGSSPSRRAETPTRQTSHASCAPMTPRRDAWPRGPRGRLTPRHPSAPRWQAAWRTRR
jgi:aminopeptidase N